MRAALLALAVSALLPGAAAAGDAQAADDFVPPPGLIGLLAPPATAHGPAEAGCLRLDARTEHLLFDAPDPTASPAGRLRLDDPGAGTEACLLPQPAFLPPGASQWLPLPHLEMSYEESALAVLARSGDWSRIALPEGRQAWLAPIDGQRYAPLPELLAGSLAYLMPGWDGQLCDTPGDDACRGLPVDPDQAVTVHGHRDTPQGTWLDVELFDAWCSGNEPRSLARGWIRATGTDARPAVWFHSRGC